MLSHFNMRHPASGLSLPAPSSEKSSMPKRASKPSTKKAKPQKGFDLQASLAPKGVEEEKKEKKKQSQKAPKERSSEEDAARVSLGLAIGEIKKASLELGAVLPAGHPLLKKKEEAIAAIKLARSKN